MLIVRWNEIIGVQIKRVGKYSVLVARAAVSHSHRENIETIYLICRYRPILSSGCNIGCNFVS